MKRCAFLLLACILTFVTTKVFAATTPAFLIYEGRILKNDGTAVTAQVTLRFSIWQNADWVATDTGSDGTMNTSALTYSGWQEEHTVTPSSLGVISLELGSNEALPFSMDWDLHRYLQVEIKNAGEADTEYQLLDSSGDEGTDSDDRSLLGAMAYAKNAETVGNRSIGSASGNILVLKENGTIAAAQMGEATNATLFTINALNEPGDAALAFGNQISSQMLSFMDDEQRFAFSDDVHVAGTISGSGGMTIAGAAVFESTVTVNDVTYTFPSSDGIGGYVLKTDGIGGLFWGTDADTAFDASGLDERFVNTSGDTLTGALVVEDDITGDALTITNLQNCDSIDTDADGTLHCGTDNSGTDGLGTEESDLRYINTSGDAMQGALSVRSTITASGTIASEQGLTLNARNADQDAVLIFGNNILPATITFSSDNQRFAFSTDVHVAGDIESTGALHAASLRADDLLNCDSIDTDENGKLECGNDATGSSAGTISSGTNPPWPCSAARAGALWMDTETGMLYACDTTGGRNAWLTTHDISLVGEQIHMCKSGGDIGNDDHCAMSLGNGLGAGIRGDIGIYLPHKATITGYGFSSNTLIRACRLGGSYDIEVWSTSTSASDNIYHHAGDIATTLSGESSHAASLGVHIDGDRYVLFGIDNNCRQSMHDWNLTVYYRWRHE